MPFTAEERREMSIVGEKSLAFLEKGKEYVDLYRTSFPHGSTMPIFPQVLRTFTTSLLSEISPIRCGRRFTTFTT
jgi:hypothetical protein